MTTLFYLTTYDRADAASLIVAAGYVVTEMSDFRIVTNASFDTVRKITEGYGIVGSTVEQQGETDGDLSH